MQKERKLYYECLAEFFGTFLFVACGIGCVAALKIGGASYGQWEISIIWGLAVALGAYLSAGISGAHLNPSVTIAFAAFGTFPARKILPYIAAQMLGAFTAAFLVYSLYSNLFIEKSLSEAAVFTTFPHKGISLTQAFMTEFSITALLVGGIFALGDDKNGIPRGALAPFLVGILVAVLGASFGPLTGFSMNAARDFPPRLFAFLAGFGSSAMTGNLAVPYALIPLTAPILGGLCGALFYTKLLGEPLARAQLNFEPPLQAPALKECAAADNAETPAAKKDSAAGTIPLQI